MPADQMMFAGIELSSGRKPVTFATLDDELKIRSLDRWSLDEAFTCLKSFEQLWLGVSLPANATESSRILKEYLIQAGFRAYPQKNEPRQFVETNAQDCYHVLIGKKPFPRRSLEGRLQRSAVLYEQGLQITDPIEAFEEITRYKLVQGILPLENIYTTAELDALMAAYVAWLLLNRPGQIVLKGEFALPA